MLWLTYHWSRLQLYQRNDNPEKISFSILIPFRNEEKNLLECITRVVEQNYPAANFELIAINDHSEDTSEAIVLEAMKIHSQVKLLNIQVGKGKKNALTEGVFLAKNKWIITLDADCVVGKNWLVTLSDYLSKNEKQYVVLPVVFAHENTCFEKVQSLEFLTLIASTAAFIQAGKPILSNGANLAFTKEIFYRNNGFEDNREISSGDDVFLLQKVARQDSRLVGYVHHPDVIAYTDAANSIVDFIDQRVRWGGKSAAYTSLFAKATAGLIVLINLALFCCLILSLFGFIPWWKFGVFFGVKFIFDFVFLLMSTPFYGKEKLLFYSPLLAGIYPFYIFVISFLATWYKPRWKGRTINADS